MGRHSTKVETPLLFFLKKIKSFSVTPNIHSFSVAVNGLVHQMNQQKYLGGQILWQTGSAMGCYGDTFVVSSLLPMPHDEDRVLSAFLSSVLFQDDASTLSCYVLKLTRWHEALDVHLTNGFCRVFLAECPKSSCR
jgi:hypothetical protein